MPNRHWPARAAWLSNQLKGEMQPRQWWQRQWGVALKSEGQERLPDLGSSSPFDSAVGGLLLTDIMMAAVVPFLSYPLTYNGFTLGQFTSSYILAGTTVITKWLGGWLSPLQFLLWPVTAKSDRALRQHIQKQRYYFANKVYPKAERCTLIHISAACPQLCAFTSALSKVSAELHLTCCAQDWGYKAKQDRQGPFRLRATIQSPISQ